MHHHLKHRGQSLIEIIFAIAVFVTGVVTIGYLLFDAYTALRQNIEFTQARFLASEGIEAVRGMRDANFGNVTIGTHGLAITGTTWSFASTTDIEGKFTREIVVTAVDAETKKIMSRVHWNGTDVRENTISLTSYLTNWKQTYGDAGSLDVDTASITLTASSTELGGLLLANNGTTTITVEKMKVQWDNNSLLERITAGGTDIYAHSTSTSGLASNVLVDIGDISLAPNETMTIEALQFTGDMTGTNLIATFIFDDESRKHVHISL